jgi:hypothetical protein
VIKSSIPKKRHPRRREVAQRQTHDVIVIDDDGGERVRVQSTLAVSNAPLVEPDIRSKRPNAGPDCVFCLDGEATLPPGTQTQMDIQSENDRYRDTEASSHLHRNIFDPVQDTNEWRLDSPSQGSGSGLLKPQQGDILVPYSGTRTELPLSKLSGGLKTSPIEISDEVPPASASRGNSLAPDLFGQPPFPELRMNNAQSHISSASSEAGPSGYRPYRMPQDANEESQRDVVTADVIELGSSVDEARPEEGEYNVVHSLYEHATERFAVSSPPSISYLDTKRLICYLCRAKLKEPSQLLGHESTDYHLDRLNDEAAVEKGLASLRKYGLLRHSYNDSTTRARNELATGIESYGHYRPQTVISGEDRAAKFIEDMAMEDSEDALMENEDEVLVVSNPYMSHRSALHFYRLGCSELLVLTYAHSRWPITRGSCSVEAFYRGLGQHFPSWAACPGVGHFFQDSKVAKEEQRTGQSPGTDRQWGRNGAGTAAESIPPNQPRESGVGSLHASIALC